MALSVQQFVHNLTDSGLMSVEQLSDFQASLVEPAADGETLARQLVKRQQLTHYQASAVYQGKYKHLVFDEYVVQEKIGQGGMGVVLKAQHRRMRRLVAVKILPERHLRYDEAVQRFYREVEAAARLSHTNIVRAYDAREQDGVHYLIMQYVDGDDLAAVVKQRGPLPLAETIDYMRQAAAGLQYAHEEGIIHRDIKPGNLLLDTKGTIRILDMGLARFSSGTEDNTAPEGLTQSGQIMGTVDYMAPEQAKDTRSADARSDIYGLGATFYRLLADRVMYERETVMNKLLAHLDEPIPALRDAREDVPAWFDAIYQKMVAKRPEDRYQTMAEVLAALEAGKGTQATALAAPRRRRPERPASRREASRDVAVTEFLAKSHPPAPATPRPPGVNASATISTEGFLEREETISRSLASEDTGNGIGPFAATPASVPADAATIPANRATAEYARRKSWIIPAAAIASFVVLLLVGWGVASLLSPSNGAVRIKFDEPVARLEVSIDGDVVEASRLAEPLPLAAGEHQLVVLHEQHEPYVETFLVAGGADLTTITVTLTPKDRPVTAASEGVAEPAPVPGLISDQIEHEGKVRFLDFSPDGRLMASSGEDKVVRVWDVATGLEVKQLALGAGASAAVRFHPHGNYLAAGSSSRGIGWRFKLWRLPGFEEVAPFAGVSNWVPPFAFSPDGTYLFSRGPQSSIVKWELDQAAERVRFATPQDTNNLSVSSDGKQIVTTHGRAHAIRVWDAATGEELHEFTYDAPKGRPFTDAYFALFTPDAQRLVVGARADLWTYDLNSGAKLWGFRRHIWNTHRGALTPDGTAVITVGGEGDVDHAAVTNWDTKKTVRVLRKYKGANDVAVHPSGRLVATAGPGRTIKLWDPRNWSEVREAFKLDATDE